MKKVDIVHPISGFPEFLPEQQILVNRILGIITKHYELHNFVPIETHPVELSEVLTAKGGDEIEIYGLRRLKLVGDDDSTKYSLPFDLTVPLARYVVEHSDDLVFPFKRYQVQKVFRGERPQAGRYHSFIQSDIDIIGKGELSLMNDAELVLVTFEIFSEMQIGKFIIRINNRKILQGYLEFLGVSELNIPKVLRIINKLERIGINQVVYELENSFGMSQEKSRELLNFIELELDSDELMEYLKEMQINDLFKQGVEELAGVISGVKLLGVPGEYFAVDLRIARGLGYYTGTVYDTILVDSPGIGSICAGGRYENLAGNFTDEALPGVGISIGLTRLMFRLIKSGVLAVGKPTVAPVLVTNLDMDYMQKYLKIASDIRERGIGTEVYFSPDKIGKQLRYANNKGFTWAVIAGEDEFCKGNVLVKNLINGNQEEIAIDGLLEFICS